jgi:hypothetical protein
MIGKRLLAAGKLVGWACPMVATWDRVAQTGNINIRKQSAMSTLCLNCPLQFSGLDYIFVPSKVMRKN